MQEQINKGEIMCRNNNSVWWFVVEKGTEWWQQIHAALKLQFRQTVILMCSSNARKLFIFLKKRHVKSAQELTDNLKNLFRQLKNDKTIIRLSLESNLPIALSQTKLLEEKDCLRKLCYKEVVKHLKKKKKEERQTKKKKLMKMHC